MSERSKEHASKACEVKASASSNLALSAFRVPGFVPEPFLFFDANVRIRGYRPKCMSGGLVVRLPFDPGVELVPVDAGAVSHGNADVGL